MQSAEFRALVEAGSDSVRRMAETSAPTIRRCHAVRSGADPLGFRRAFIFLVAPERVFGRAWGSTELKPGFNKVELDCFNKVELVQLS